MKEAFSRKKGAQMSVRDLFDLSGKCGYVTGAGSGLGRAIARGIAAAGGTVVVSDVRREGAESIAEEIQSGGGHATALCVDVADKTQVEALIEETVRKWGRLDFAFNIAGILKLEKPEEISEKNWDEELRVDLTGVFLCSQAAGRQMIGNGGGKIINTASISGLVVNSGLTYSTATRIYSCKSNV